MSIGSISAAGVTPITDVGIRPVGDESLPDATASGAAAKGAAAPDPAASPDPQDGPVDPDRRTPAGSLGSIVDIYL